MARQKLRIGERGKIGHREEGPRKWVARCQYHDSWGRRRNLTARGATKGAATSALKTKWHNISQKIITREEASEVMTFDQLVARFFESLRTRKTPKRPLPQSIQAMEYRYTTYLAPHFGELTLDQCTAGIMSDALQSMIGPNGSMMSSAKECRRLLVNVYDYASQHGFVQHNVARSIPIVGYVAPKPKSWNDEEIQNIRTALKHWIQMPSSINKAILDIYDMTLATGCRISEVLGMTWENVYLPEHPDEQAWVFIGDAVLYRDNKANAIGLPKGGKLKKLTLPSFGVDILRRLKPDNATGLVFTNRSGNAHYASCLYETAERAFARAKKDLGIDVPEKLQFHTSRKTVLTLIARTRGIEAASEQGGHSTPDVTRRHYLAEDESRVIDHAAALEKFGKTEE